MSSPTETELVESARDGGVESFGELYQRHYLSMVGLAYCVLADRHLAEDAAQEAFWVACRDLGRLRRADRFASWLAGICRNVARRMATSQSQVALPDDLPAPANEDSAAERGQCLRQAVERLPRRAREVVMLHYFAGQSHQQIAETLRISPPAVHGRLTRARRKIAEELGRLGIEGDGP